MYPIGTCVLGIAHMHLRSITLWRVRVRPRTQTRLSCLRGPAVVPQGITCSRPARYKLCHISTRTPWTDTSGIYTIGTCGFGVAPSELSPVGGLVGASWTSHPDLSIHTRGGCGTITHRDMCQSHRRSSAVRLQWVRHRWSQGRVRQTTPRESAAHQ